MRRTTGALAALAIVLLHGGNGLAHDPVPADVTFARDIRGLLTAHCTSCHATGGSAPMPLTTYEEVRSRGRAIRDQILTRRMPKWHAARGYGAFVNDAALTPQQKSEALNAVNQEQMRTVQQIVTDARNQR